LLEVVWEENTLRMSAGGKITRFPGHERVLIHVRKRSLSPATPCKSAQNSICVVRCFHWNGRLINSVRGRYGCSVLLDQDECQIHVWSSIDRPITNR